MRETERGARDMDNAPRFYKANLLSEGDTCCRAVAHIFCLLERGGLLCCAEGCRFWRTIVEGGWRVLVGKGV